MDVELSPERTMLRNSTRAFLESRSPLSRVRELASSPTGFDPHLWADGASLGWCGMLVSEPYGGAGLGAQGVLETAIIAEEFGRLLHPGPFLPVNVVAATVTRLGSDSQRAAILPRLVAGTSVVSWALAEGPGRWDARDLGVTAIRQGAGYRIRGLKRWVQDAAAAEHLLVTCRRDNGLLQLLISSDTPGLAVTTLATADLGRRLADVEFDDVYVEPDSVVAEGVTAETELVRQFALAVVLQCAESVGATARIMEKAVAYAGDRMAFGRPIGSFQAVKHRLAEGATWLEAAQAATWSAVHALGEERSDLLRAVHVAKAFVSRHCPRIIEDCMQVQGGIAMTWEDDSHLYLRRAKSNAMLFGTAQWHADRLCDAIGMTA
jgi:alkylation response protein AidB-like acyl-CoA dehydrogenase